jgi:uncharacterized protein YkwD
MTEEEKRFFELMNRERVSRGRVGLTVDPLLVEVSREHSREMCEEGYFDHISPVPGHRTPMDRYLSALRHRPASACVGENIFYCEVIDVPLGHRAFMNSPSHRDNILYAPFRRAGVGVYKSGTGAFWVTEMFLVSSRG